MTKQSDSGQSANVIQLRKAQAVIEPVVDWCANSKYGLLRSDKLDSGKLVRLEDVACWMAKTEPRDMSLFKIFFELISNDGKGAESLYVLNSRSYAKPLIIENRPNPALASWWQFFPEIDSDSNAEFIARDIADGFKRVWPGLCDPATDHEWQIERVIARNKERAAIAVADRECRDYLGQYWPEDGFLQGLIYAVAIPITKAAELWGYGQITETQTPKSAAPATYAELVNARKLNPDNPWTDAMVALMAAEIDARSGQTGIRKGIGQQLDISVSRIGQLLTRETKRQPASGGIGTSRVVSFGGGKS